MNYFVLAQKKDRGCPLGMLNGFLYDQPAPPNTPHYGLKPWYTRANLNQSGFASKMFFNTKDRLYSFDLRSEHGYLIVSDQFRIVLDEFKVPVSECVPLSVLNAAFKNIGEKNYFVVQLSSSNYLEREDIFEPDMELVWDEAKRRFSIGRARIKENIDVPLFKIRNQDEDAIFCSEAFASTCHRYKTKGIEFLKFDEVVWKLQTPQNILDFLSESEPTIFIR